MKIRPNSPKFQIVIGTPYLKTWNITRTLCITVTVLCWCYNRQAEALNLTCAGLSTPIFYEHDNNGLYHLLFHDPLLLSVQHNYDISKLRWFTCCDMLYLSSYIPTWQLCRCLRYRVSPGLLSPHAYQPNRHYRCLDNRSCSLILISIASHAAATCYNEFVGFGVQFPCMI